MKRTSTHTALAAAGAGITLLLAGCGYGGSSSAAQSTGASTTVGSTSQMRSPQTSSDTSAASSRGSHSSTSAGASSTAVPTSSTSSPGDAPVPRCTVDQLKLTVGTGNADMQGAHRPLRFTNVSNRVCKLTGAPGVSYVAGDKGHQVGLPAQRIVGHQPVVLIPNATASAGLFISSAPRKSACQQEDVRGIRVYPPGSYQAAYVPLPEVTCKPPQSRTYLKVGPILPGPDNTGV